MKTVTDRIFIVYFMHTYIRQILIFINEANKRIRAMIHKQENPSLQEDIETSDNGRNSVPPLINFGHPWTRFIN